MRTPDTPALTGRCLCGAVSFRAGPPVAPPTVCHCTSCRRASGAHAVPWITVRAAEFAVVTGVAATFASSPAVTRTFCARCGTPLTYRHERRPDTVDITLGSLDAPERFAPVDHIWMEDAVAWYRPGDGRPQFPTTRPG